ncbi:MAG: Na/Pi symporter [Candidatus Marinimicrobia bacterium]|jgi:sodium-dependent phosphate cotransporter|nr:Na/Pi symporter [Candidatus Neomarinimicrobiota bacterium]MBT3936971.1 Na/Pi symporter [Candidatus Neomarinimicrobiota bacterium]MBT3961778.1 Na/Pi symporter [Candidatus Neomarinimicrobiota bacterium]MBT4270081.1 Na/Pi symporter [Candidatus Neomarinimicrobiota bacterium]MBT4684655.1 Na/Pi symporter [Candidatus Neomarinimicrobiota bacterium]|tara:strand:+ start:658 stop:1761 length:1104 start_codon:yes stop_codon:yes gene_type:complete
MKKDTLFILIKVSGVFGALYMFLVGIKGMSSAIKHMGADVADTIFTTTSDPFVALFIGVFSTVLFQSSSTTTSLIVGMVSSGSLGLTGAIPMIMGANIGTTVTNTIVSIGHINRGNEFKRAFAASTVHDFFNILAVLILFPLEMMFHGIQRSSEWIASLLFGKIHNVDVLQAKSPIKAAVKSGAQFVEQFSLDNDILYLILSVLVTFIMLYALVKLLRSLVLEKIEVFFDQYIFKTVMRSIGFGLVLTIMVQSSSITTSLVVPLAGAGVLTLRQIFPFTLGANIGTTVTALLAALTGTVSALIAAIGHLLFNIFGIIFIYGIPFLREIPLKLADMISEYSTQNKWIPILYLLIFFVAIPLTIIIVGG